MTEHGAEQPIPHVTPRLLDRPVADVAGAIIEDHEWHGRSLPPDADPFLEAMLGMSTRDLSTPYRHERVADVVRGALAALHDWHGPTAQRIKHELGRALEAADHPRGPQP